MSGIVGPGRNEYGDPLGYIPGDGDKIQDDPPPTAPGASNVLTKIPVQDGPIPVVLEIQKPNIFKD